MTAEKYNKDIIANLMNFFKMQLFWAALPHKFHNVVAQKEHTRIMLEEMYDVTTTQQRERNFRKVFTVDTADEAKTEENDVATFQCQQNCQGGRPKLYQVGPPKTGNHS
jgi:hypothetical protein